MKLADIPTNVAYRIESIGCAVRELSHYVAAGLRPGSMVRVLARYPETQPRFAEVELGSLRVTLPLTLAAEVSVGKA